MANDGKMLRARVVAYARARLGHKVGDGECYTLADRALRYAKAQSAPGYDEVRRRRTTSGVSVSH